MPPRRTAEATTMNVTFTLPAHVQAESVALCSDFNDWSVETIKLARNGDGTWQAMVPLERGRTYRYRYLLDGQRWENAWHAVDYVPNPYGTEDSLVVVE